jgi:DNA-binding GntR family transcriptional regulator
VTAQTNSSYQMMPITDDKLLLDRVTDQIRKAILEGTLAPGSRLSVPELSRQLNVSRTPAREALIRLQNDGLVRVIPRKGAVVLQGNPTDLLELFQFREALEGMAARLAARSMTAAEKKKLRAIAQAHAQAIRKEDLASHLALDEEFHSAIAIGSRNTKIKDELEKVRGQLVLLARALSTTPGGMDQNIIIAHEAIVNAIYEGDPSEADHAARTHVRGVLYHIQGRSVEPHPLAPVG